MSTHTENHISASDSVFHIARTFDAPRRLVFQAWTEAGHLARWWGPKGFEVRVGKFDLRPDGVFHYCMHTRHDGDMWGKFVYREIIFPEKLAFLVSFTDEHGKSIYHPYSPNWPLEVLSLVRFSEQDGKTTLDLKAIPYHASELECQTFMEGRGSMEQGWKGTFDQLAAHLARTRAGTAQSAH